MAARISLFDAEQEKISDFTGDFDVYYDAGFVMQIGRAHV